MYITQTISQCQRLRSRETIRRETSLGIQSRVRGKRAYLTSRQRSRGHPNCGDGGCRGTARLRTAGLARPQRLSTHGALTLCVSTRTTLTPCGVTWVVCESGDTGVGRGCFGGLWLYGCAGYTDDSAVRIDVYSYVRIVFIVRLGHPERRACNARKRQPEKEQYQHSHQPNYNTRHPHPLAASNIPFTPLPSPAIPSSTDST
jgi:hypothetical protein